MSERGAFVTQYTYCHRCATAICDLFARWRDEREPDDTMLVPLITERDGQPDRPYGYSIVAGKVAGVWPGHEVYHFDVELRSEIEKCLCPGHSLRIAILCEDEHEDKVLTFRG